MTPSRPTTAPDIARTTIPAVSVGLIIGIVLVAANLRVTLTGVGPLLPAIEQGSGLTSAWSGLLTTLPLLTFAITSPLVGRVSHRLGSARLLFASLIVLAVGTILRSVPGIGWLFTGTVILSAAIACGNVLLPAIIRRHVPPRRIGAISALYVTVMGFVAAVSSGISVPLADVLPNGWRDALAWGAVLSLVAIVAWLPRIRHDRPPATGTTHAPTPWRSGLAWQVSAFMGLQSLGFYTIVAWLPSILARDGMTATAAGWMLFYYQIVALIASSLVPVFTRGRDDQRWTAAVAATLVAIGFLVLFAASGLAVVAVTLLGLGGGVCLVLALGFQSQRANDHRDAAALAGMAQSIGYLIAAAGPLLLGVLHDVTGTWSVPLVLLGVIGLAMAVAGFAAGRDRQLAPPKDRQNSPGR